MSDVETFARATRAYQTSGALAPPPAAVVLAVHQGIARRLTAARTAYEQNRLDQMCRHTSECCRILIATRSAMDFAAAGPVGAALEGFYARMGRGIGSVLRKPDVTAAFDALIGEWREMCRENNSVTK